MVIDTEEIYFRVSRVKGGGRQVVNGFRQETNIY
jgi:hypothetical protein